MPLNDFAITWDQTGERLYETGVDRVVLYPIKETIVDQNDPYDAGVAWNGITGISQSASGGEASPLWADNIKYLNLVSAEEASLSIEAYTYPEEFEQCDGTRELITGATIGQQPRKMFGITYRTLIGNDQKQTDFGYKIHFVYGCLASPSDRSYATVNDSPEAISFSWSVTTTPVEVVGFKPTSIITVDSTKTAPAKLAALETIIYGTAASGGSEAVAAKLPLPAAIVETLT
ncbi:MAG: hypothetical protein J6U54_20520 [Clostridiales bacterium]|nr:hypothetical protein [Clostridiales bacterium]